MSKYIKLEDAIEAVTSIFRVSALFGGINDDENMWREKAEKVLAKCEVIDITKQGLEHIEISEDCISREYILSFLEGEVMGDDDYIAGMNDEQREIREVVRNAPSVVPNRQKQVTSKLKNPCDSLLTADSDECKEQKSKLDCASVTPTERTGKWIAADDDENIMFTVYKCSECGNILACSPHNYCPNCGARMESDTE